MKLQTVWTRVVLVIYLATIIGVCLYVPTYVATSYMPISRIIFTAAPIRGILHGFCYDWVWNLDGKFNKYFVILTDLLEFNGGSSGLIVKVVVDAGDIIWEVVGLTAIAWVLFINGPPAWARRRGKQPDPVNRT